MIPSALPGEIFWFGIFYVGIAELLLEAFRGAYPDVTTVVGNFRGSLSNHNDYLRLLDQQGNLADEVHYFEGGEWPVSADGGGSTLELTDPDADNREGQSWAPSDEQNGSA